MKILIVCPFLVELTFALKISVCGISTSISVYEGAKGFAAPTPGGPRGPVGPVGPWLPTGP